MLQLRPNCEQCDKALPANAADAMICSFECTFCAACVERILENVCPNCGGGFAPRPIRPSRDWNGGNSLAQHPASSKRVFKPANPGKHMIFAAAIKAIGPGDR